MTPRPSRRSFLKTSALGAGVLGLTLWESDPLVHLLSTPRRDPADITPDDYRDWIGTEVSLEAPDGRHIPARIAGVYDVDCHPELEQFTVQFASRESNAAPAGTYRIEHPEFTCELHVGPVVTRRDHVDYEAAFTRFRA